MLQTNQQINGHKDQDQPRRRAIAPALGPTIALKARLNTIPSDQPDETAVWTILAFVAEKNYFAT
jgi:hypothetical protein